MNLKEFMSLSEERQEDPIAELEEKDVLSLMR